MAEIVNELQERSIPEYELIRTHQIFSEDEIRTILRSRENYQYKLSKNSKSLIDYGNFIIYEKKLHSMVVAIENSRKEQFPGLKAAMSNRIVHLYKQGLRSFPNEKRLWEAYIKFCKKNFESEVPNAYEKLIQHQGHHPINWCNAALWFYENGNNFDKAKNIFFRGLQRHPESEMLYTAFFGVLLAETSNQPPECREASLERATALYNTAKKKICFVSFLINLFNQCEAENYKHFSRPLQRIIIKDMMELYPREEIIWDLLARRELAGDNVAEFLDGLEAEPSAPEPEEKKDDPDEKEENKGNVSVKKRTLKRRIELCCYVYNAAVAALKTTKMWEFYINAMIELNTDTSTQRVLKRKMLGAAFQGAYQNKCLSEHHFYAYINLMIEGQANRDKILEVMKEATTCFNTIKLWEQRMIFHVMEDDNIKVNEVFCLANERLGADSYPLWKLAIQYYQTNNQDQDSKLVDLFKKACARKEPMFLSFRPQYLEWSIVNHPIQTTRALYEELMNLKPPCLELHQKMILLETQSIKPELEYMRKCYENAIREFGKTRTDVWIDYIKFERHHGEPKRVSNLFERAKLTLEPIYVDNFVTEHCLLST